MTAATGTSSGRIVLREEGDMIKRSIFLSLSGLAGRQGSMRADPGAYVGRA
jgi:hypothetical protein